ncbi:MAG: BMC domain-containing protein [Serratia sp. (in: enterobacteria)]|uniref:BMC domain-containing protein n=1 Tax=Serratia sp. (in: enterobacteria) TaxID=616 RepID=UPI003F2A9265
MSGQSLGLIETVGMVAAVEAADAAVKSANVHLIGYELTKGGGMVTVKLEGEVGAINAAVAAAVGAANRIGQVYAYKVIARTAQYIEGIVHSAETVGAKPEVQAMPDLTIPLVQLEEPLSVSCMGSSEQPQEQVKEAVPPVQQAASETTVTEPKPAMPKPAAVKKEQRTGGNKRRS